MPTYSLSDAQSDYLHSLRERTTTAETFQIRLDYLAQFLTDVARDNEVDAHEIVRDFAIQEYVGTDVGYCFSLERVLHDLRHFAFLAENDAESAVADFHEEGDESFLDSISMQGTSHVAHQVYYSLGELYAVALRARLPAAQDAVYEAVYRRMYEVVRDPRPVMYQLAMETEYACTPPHEWLSREGDPEWTLENTEKLADALIEAWVASYRDCEECYTIEMAEAWRTDCPYPRDFDAILSDVEAREAGEEAEDAPEAC